MLQRGTGGKDGPVFYRLAIPSPPSYDSADNVTYD